MDSGILNALFRDPVINKLTSGKPPVAGRPLPENLIARVIALKGDLATLRWEGGQFSASLNARVIPGETLLLQYNGIQKGRSHYKIMARFTGEIDNSGMANRDPGEPLLFGLMPSTAGKQGSSPALVRFFSEGKNNAEEVSEAKPLLELFLDTEHFGLVLVRFFYYKDNRLECRFIVESKESGLALQREAEKIIKENGEGGEPPQGEVIRWSIGNLRQVAAEALHQGGGSLNTQA